MLPRLLLIICILSLIGATMTGFYIEVGNIPQTEIETQDGNVWEMTDDRQNCVMIMHDCFTDCKEDDTIVICLAVF